METSYPSSSDDTESALQLSAKQKSTVRLSDYFGFTPGRTPRIPLWQRMGIGLLFSLLGLVIRLALHPVMGGRSPFLFMFLAVLFAAYVGGGIAGLVAVVVGSVLGSVFVVKSFMLWLIIPYFIITVSAVYIIDFMHRRRLMLERLATQLQESREELRRLNHALERNVQERTVELQTALQKDRISLQRLQAVVASLPMAAILIDEDRNVLELNEMYCQTFSIGLPPAQAKKLSQSQLLELFLRAVTEPDTHMDKVNAAISKNGAVFDFEIHLKDGRTIVRDLIPVQDEGMFYGRLFLYRDVTKERRIDKSKSEFMSLASHQLRTPLTGVRWSIGRLQRDLSDNLSALHEKLFAEAQRATMRMAETIDTMLKISRIEADTAHLDIKECDVRKLLLGKQEIFRNQYEAKSQTFTLECPEHLVVHTDITCLKEILVNLIQNAIKYTPEGGSISARAFRPDHHIVIEVQDTGYGIPLHQQKLVFQKFFRGDNVVDRDTDGTGLGLYLVALMTSALRGEITVESQENKGTLFRLSLPLEPNQS